MNRRVFLQRSSLLLPGLTLSGIMGFKPEKLLAEPSQNRALSLSIISDQSEKALAKVQDLFALMNLADKNIQYQEYILNGKHRADIAYTHAGELVDYHNSEGEIAENLRKISSQLGLPRECKNPILAHFSYGEMLRPSGVQIFKGNTLIVEKAFPADNEIIQLDGLKGRVSVELGRNRSVRFVETSCRHKTCLKMGSISQPGQNLVCVPNQIVVNIAGTKISGVDSITF